jgi:GWxTD domain-containing protein
MRPLPLLFALALQSSPGERATEPTFRGQGGGTLTVIDVPEKAGLDFFVVECVAVLGDRCTFAVFRSGEKAGRAEEGADYLEEASGVRFRIEPRAPPFAFGDTFSFVTFEDVSKLDELVERWAEQYVKWILSREEKERLESLEGVEEKLAFIESFWRRRDPTPGTPANETREEHARRFAYAIRHFGAGTPGWATDRGKIYILLGAPNAIERNPAGRTAYERPSEVWTYNNAANPRLPASLDIAFVDFTATGRYELVSASNLDILAPLRTNLGYAMSELEAIGLLRSGGTILDPNTGLRSDIDPTRLASNRFDFEQDLLSIADVPRLTLPNLAAVTEASATFPSIPIRADLSFFSGGGTRAIVPITLAIPYARLTPVAAGESYRYHVDVLLKVEGEDVTPLEDRIEVDVPAGDLGSYRESELLYDTSLLLAPGAYEATVTVRDNPSGAVGQVTTEIEIPELAGEGLRLSSLLLATGAVDAPALGGPSKAPFQFGDVRLVPNVSKQFFSGGSMTAYVEAYGLSGETQVKVELFLLKGGRLFSKVAPSYHRPGPGEEVSIRSAISLRDFLSGEYVLRARITDETTGEVAERDAAFTVRPPRTSR